MLVQFQLSQFHDQGRSVFIVGSIPSLGAWNPEQSVELRRSGAGLSTEEIDIESIQEARGIQYKYLTCNYDTATRHKSNVSWERADNRTIDLGHKFSDAQHEKGTRKVQLVAIVEDKGFNERRDNWPKIKIEEVPMENVEDYPLQMKQNVSGPDYERKKEIVALASTGRDRAPFDMADKAQQPLNVNGGYSKEVNQMAGGQRSFEIVQRISPVPQGGYLGSPAGKSRYLAGGDQDLAAKFDASGAEYQDMLTTFNKTNIGGTGEQYDSMGSSPEQANLEPVQIRRQADDFQHQNYYTQRDVAGFKPNQQHYGALSDPEHAQVKEQQISLEQVNRKSVPVEVMDEYTHEQPEMGDSMNRPPLKTRNKDMPLQMRPQQETLEEHQRNAAALKEQQVASPGRTRPPPGGLKAAHRVKPAKPFAYDVEADNLNKNGNTAPRTTTSQPGAGSELAKEQLAQEKIDTNINQIPIQSVDADVRAASDQGGKEHVVNVAPESISQHTQPAITAAQEQPEIPKPQSAVIVKASKAAVGGDQQEDKLDQQQEQTGQKTTSPGKTPAPVHFRPASAQSAEHLGPDYQGIVLESMTGPQCQIDEIDDFTQATVGLLKDAVCHCLNLADWVQRHHIQLYFGGLALVDDEAILADCEIKGGARINYIIMIA